MEHGQTYEAHTKGSDHIQVINGLTAVDLELTEKQKEKIEEIEG
jgi:hypothetical protein